jgi:hypothetical protein
VRRPPEQIEPWQGLSDAQNPGDHLCASDQLIKITTNFTMFAFAASSTAQLTRYLILSNACDPCVSLSNGLQTHLSPCCQCVSTEAQPVIDAQILEDFAHLSVRRQDPVLDTVPQFL